jgi:polysaccharide export outer membrane protein
MKTAKTNHPKSRSSDLLARAIGNTIRFRRRIRSARLRLAALRFRASVVKAACGALTLMVLLSPFQARAQEASTNTPAQPGSAHSAADLYRIGPGDVLEVRVFNRPQLSRDAVRVDNRGMIRMPMIESEIRAGCRTESELAEELATLYLKYQRHPHVDVFIKEYSSKPVAVMGAVDKPGQFQLQRRVRLLELVSLAGGPTERAGQRVLLAHGTEIASCDENVSASPSGFEAYDLNSTLRGNDSSNPYVHPGDIITVPEAQQVFVVGNVFKPTSISLKEKVTVSQAVAMAGGTMADAKKDRVRILRQLPGSPAKTEIVVDLDAISKRKADDIELKPNDIIDVPTSAGKRLFRGLLGAVAPTISRSVRVVP